jgi:glucose/arabinose dehydrogenase/mono/diheme cytochrome c family protein
MRLASTNRLLQSFIVLIAIVCVTGPNRSVQSQSFPGTGNKTQACPDDDSGLSLPPGFCATVFADNIGHARHMVVAPSGVVFVNTWSGRYYGNDAPHAGGFLVALQDKTSKGKAEVSERFGETVQSGGAGGTGIGIHENRIYAEINDRIVRYSLSPGSIVPPGPPETIVSGLPLSGDHPMHPFIIDAKGAMYVDVATATNSCQVKNRTLKSPGVDPCTELETRGGVWRYDANKTNQIFSPAQRFATGIRNAEGFGIDSTGRLFVAQHGRDQLHANWPDRFQPDQEATLPAEELLLLKQGGDYGWPECYYDQFVQKLVLAPEYGGDGGKTVGACANKIAPVAAFPAHWAPNAMVYYDKKQFPEHYRGGVFIAFHGSWNRAPYPQGGYNVVFQPLAGDRASGQCEIFADGFAGPMKSPDQAAHRPSGLAVGPDGSLYVSDDIRGRIYKIVYEGSDVSAVAQVTACPSLTAPAGAIVEATANPPEGTHPDAGAAATRDVPVPEGATREMVLLGEQVYRGQVGGATCTGCHGDNGQGTPLGPNLTGKKWLWSDGSYAGITKTIAEGVAQPKQYRSPMPAMGGAQLTPDQISAVAAYVWSLSHRAPVTSGSHVDPSKIAIPGEKISPVKQMSSNDTRILSDDIEVRRFSL